jgi:hypothetical protein
VRSIPQQLREFESVYERLKRTKFLHETGFGNRAEGGEREAAQLLLSVFGR